MSNILNNDDGKKGEIPLLPLVPIKHEYEKEDLVYFKLRIEPGSDTSMLFSFSIPKLNGSEDIRSSIRYHKDICKVWTGMNATTASKRDALVEQVLVNSALTAYRDGRNKHHSLRVNNAKTALRLAGQVGGETLDELNARIAALNMVTTMPLNNDDVMAGNYGVVTYMSPVKALARIKRYLRRKCRKPANMTVREFYNHFHRINAEEIPLLPPGFSDAQKLSNDEIVDILLFAFPAKWQGEMQRQGFDPYGTGVTPEAILHFAERMEAAEAMDGSSSTKKVDNHSKGSGKSNSKKVAKKNNGGSGERFCHYHGKNPTHDSNQCKVLQKMANSAKENSSSSSYPKKDYSKNKTWDRKASDAKQKTKKDLATFIKKTMRNEMNTFQKKRKSDDDDSDALSEGELNAIESLDLSDFDYSDMANLKLASTTDDTVMTAEEEDEEIDC